jgi:sigma-B regulation protein RsbU (phosphoserine phosphatase)
MTPEQLSSQISVIFFGTVFFIIGFTAALVAIIRRGRSVRIIAWLAMWSGMYGIRMLIRTPAVFEIIPGLMQAAVPFTDVAISYMTLVFALLAWQDLTKSFMRKFISIEIAAGLVVGIAGIIWYIFTGKADTFILFNNLLALSVLIVLVIIVTVKKLSEKFLVLPDRGVLAVGTLIFAGEALYSNLAQMLNLPTWAITGWLGFAVFLFSIAFVAAKIVFSNERRLHTIEVELETARQIQNSILPASVPNPENLNIHAVYEPVTAVAGDFYEFICIDDQRTGFFVADVSGHGIPAALIASMVKVAMHSVQDSANDPGEVMRRLCNILGDQLKGQFVTAAYLLIDMSSGKAVYTAAGHPPLLFWDASAKQVQSIESNGLVLGFRKDQEYPACEIPFKEGDRFLLYTDGLTETENPQEQLFGEHRLNDVLRLHENDSAQQLGDQILLELNDWQTSQAEQQDDITFIIIDINQPT